VTWFHVGLAREQWGDHAGAIRAWKRAGAWLYFLVQGDGKAASGDWIGAAGDYRIAGQIRPDDPLAAARLKRAEQHVP